MEINEIKTYKNNTIIIPTDRVNILDFNMSNQKKIELIEKGYQYTTIFIENNKILTILSSNTFSGKNIYIV